MGKQKQWKNRLVDDEFLKILFHLQRPGSIIDFKTDSQHYFGWSLERFHRSRYTVAAVTRDLHTSDMNDTNFVTPFESIFLEQGVPICAARLEKRDA